MSQCKDHTKTEQVIFCYLTKMLHFAKQSLISLLSKLILELNMAYQFEYVNMNHQTSHKCPFFGNLFMHHIKAEYINIPLMYSLIEQNWAKIQLFENL